MPDNETALQTRETVCNIRFLKLENRKEAVGYKAVEVILEERRNLYRHVSLGGQ